MRFLSYINNLDKYLVSTRLWETFYIRLAKYLKTHKYINRQPEKASVWKQRITVSDATQRRLWEDPWSYTTKLHGRPERSQRRLWRDVFNISHRTHLRDLQICSLWDVSETLHETSQRCICDASMLAGYVFSVGFKTKPL